MKRQELLAISAHFSGYDVRFSENGESFEIIHPYGKESIAVYMENAPHTEPYMVCFSFQHRHLDTAGEVIAYVNDIISGNVLAIEFFKDGRNCVGGDLDAKEVRELPQGIPERFLGQGQIKLFDIADSFRVRGWAQDADFDAKLLRDAQGNVSIQKTEI